MTNKTLACYLAIFFSLLLSPAFSQEITIRNINVVDVTSGKVLPSQTVIIKEDKILTIGPAKKVKPAGQAIDGTGKFLMPGLIDAHIHFFQSGSLYTRPDAVDFTSVVPYKEERTTGFNNAPDYLDRYLAMGITTVVDVGGPFDNFKVRDSIARTAVTPNILVTGPLFSIVDRKKLELNDPPIIRIASTGDVDALFQKMLPYKPDFIKVWYIAGRDYPADKSFPLVKHLGDLCKKNNLRLAVHATELETAKLAVEAGATVLVHSVDDAVITDDFVRKLKEKKVTYIPTLIVSKNYYRAFSGKLPHHRQDLAWANPFAYGTLTDIKKMDTASWPAAFKWLHKNGIPSAVNKDDSIMAVNLRKLTAAGVNIATGTDAGNIGTFHASSYLQELEAMKNAGLNNAQILKASTVNAAAAFGKGEQLGSATPGKLADLLVLGKNPLDDLSYLNTLELVIKGGKVLQRDSIVKESAEMVVQRQLNAYNARNIDAFVDTYSEDVQLLDFEGRVIMKGHDEMRKGYGEYFSSTPDLYCEIEKRIVINNKVIDKEKVTSGGQTFSAVAVYEVKNGKITRVMFVR